ncbi:MAG: IPT/TIG domain-containing protein [Cyclobacteriaceae bacterium]|nr:IPT/TIG domain-containing protein [Cyclobacteriaceae bacterium]
MKYIFYSLIVLLFVSGCSDDPVGPAPVIEAVAPLNGNAGTSVTLAGKNFTSSSVVLFNGVKGTTHFRSDKLLIANVPAGASSGNITIQSSGHHVDFRYPFEVLATAPTASHTFYLHSNNRVASMLLPVTEYNVFNDISCPLDLYQQILHDVYNKFEDDFDFLFLIHNNETRPNKDIYGYNRWISNAVEGIGIQRFDYAGDYGSSGRLKSIITMPTRNGLVTGPLLHEIMHTWANSAFPTENINAATGEVYNSSGHWGMSGCGGALGGFAGVLEENVGSHPDKYRIDLNIANGYSNFELYLMGLIGPEELTPFDVFYDLVSLQMDVLEAKTRVRYTREKIETDLGLRVPAYTEAQKEFKGLVLVITTIPLSTDEFNRFDQQVDQFFKPADEGTALVNFWEATQGLGLIQAGNLSQSMKE